MKIYIKIFLALIIVLLDIFLFTFLTSMVTNASDISVFLGIMGLALQILFNILIFKRLAK